MLNFDDKKVRIHYDRYPSGSRRKSCTPCRVGTENAVKLMVKPKWDTTLPAELSDVMADASVCGLDQAAGNPINCVLKYFPDDL